MTFLLLLSALVAPSAFADDTLAAASAAAVADDDDEFFTDTSSADTKGANAGMPDSASFNDDDELVIAVTPPPVAKVTVLPPSERDLGSTPASTAMPVNTAGAKLLTDNWAPTIVVADKDAVVIEMPVLYANSKKDFDGVAYWLIAEVYADGKKVAESRTNVTRDSVADKGPSIQFFRMFAPVSAPSGVLEVKVFKNAGKNELLFTRSVKYAVGS